MNRSQYRGVGMDALGLARIRGELIVIALVVGPAQQSSAALNDNCTVSILNRTALVRPLGLARCLTESWVIGRGNFAASIAYPPAGDDIATGIPERRSDQVLCTDPTITHVHVEQ